MFPVHHSFLVIIALIFILCNRVDAESLNGDATGKIRLPPVESVGVVSIVDAIYHRKAVRSFTKKPASLNQVATLLWAGGGKTIDGVTGATRAYAAAGGLYPLEFYLVAHNVTKLEKGIYRYQWEDHTLVPIRAGAYIDQTAAATYSASFKNNAVAACIVITSITSRTTIKYGQRGARRYVPMAVGGAGQNIHLAAQALGIGTYIIGAFDDNKLSSILGIQAREEIPMYIMPIGVKTDR